MNLCGEEKMALNNNVFSNEGHQVFSAFTFAGIHPHI